MFLLELPKTFFLINVTILYKVYYVLIEKANFFQLLPFTFYFIYFPLVFVFKNRVTVL